MFGAARAIQTDAHIAGLTRLAICGSEAHAETFNTAKWTPFAWWTRERAPAVLARLVRDFTTRTIPADGGVVSQIIIHLGHKSAEVAEGAARYSRFVVVLAAGTGFTGHA